MAWEGHGRIAVRRNTGFQMTNYLEQQAFGLISKITRVYTRVYSDSRQVTTYVEWIDESGATGRTEGDKTNPHMAALIARGKREGVPLIRECW